MIRVTGDNRQMIPLYSCFLLLFTLQGTYVHRRAAYRADLAMCKGKTYIFHSLLYMYHIRLIRITTNAREAVRTRFSHSIWLCYHIYIHTVYYAFRSSYQATYIQLDGTERETQAESSWCRIEWQLLSATFVMHSSCPLLLCRSWSRPGTEFEGTR